MKNIKSLLILCLISASLFCACKKEKEPEIVDPCENTICQNNGICVDGDCDCLPGTSGVNCEIIDPCYNVDCFNGGNCESGTCNCPSGYSGDQCENYTPVATRLLSETPLEIAESGIPLDSLYGKWYAGGYIFYIDLDDIILNKEGLVAAENDFGNDFNWGCTDQDSEAVNINTAPTFPETVVGARPGDGIENTIAISNSSCSSGSAASACHSYTANTYNDWFLPSRGGLLLMYYNLKQKGHGDFSPASYWSSTEHSSNQSYFVFFNDGNAQPVLKTSALRVRPARAF